MKKFITTTLLLISLITSGVMASMPTDVSAENEHIKVKVNGEYVVFPDQEPVMVDGRTLVPVRAVLEKLGVNVVFKAEYNNILFTKGGKTVGIAPDYKMMVVKENEYSEQYNVPIDVAPQIINERTLCPIRCIVEQFGCNVGWDEENNTVIIESWDYVPVQMKAIIIGE